MARRLAWALLAAVAIGLVAAPAAWASSGGTLVPAGFLGLPSISSILEAIANGFTQALAGALVPGWLKHATVATIQSLVALPDPARWTHVGRLAGEMRWLGVSLMPVTIAVAAIRYWAMGITGQGSPASAVTRAAASAGVLVAYSWIVQQVVDGTNTITHAILGFPQVGNGLASLVSVLFAGALLSGVGSALMAVLVIVGLIFAVALFAIQMVVTLLLAVLTVAGPPLIAVSGVPELSHLARGWARALGVLALVPISWTVLFASAGALTLDATSASGASGLPGHVEAALAALATWVLAVKLPLMLLGELRGFLIGGFKSQGGGGGASGSAASVPMPGNARMKAAKDRLQSAASSGAPAVAGRVGAAAGALGAPQGGPLGALRRAGLRAAGRPGPPAANRGGIRARTTAAAAILRGHPVPGGRSGGARGSAQSAGTRRGANTAARPQRRKSTSGSASTGAAHGAGGAASASPQSTAAGQRSTARRPDAGGASRGAAPVAPARAGRGEKAKRKQTPSKPIQKPLTNERAPSRQRHSQPRPSEKPPAKRSGEPKPKHSPSQGASKPPQAGARPSRSRPTRPVNTTPKSAPAVRAKTGAAPKQRPSRPAARSEQTQRPQEPPASPKAAPSGRDAQQGSGRARRDPEQRAPNRDHRRRKQ